MEPEALPEVKDFSPTQDQLNFGVALESALINRFFRANLPAEVYQENTDDFCVIAEASIGNSAYRAVVYELCKYYELKCRSFVSEQIVHRTDMFGSYNAPHHGEYGGVCWECYEGTKMKPTESWRDDREGTKRDLRKLVVIELPPLYADFRHRRRLYLPGEKERLFDPSKATTEKDLSFFGRWYLVTNIRHRGDLTLKDYAASDRFQAKRRRIIYVKREGKKSLKPRKGFEPKKRVYVERRPFGYIPDQLL
jgi:hypothetical protein